MKRLAHYSQYFLRSPALIKELIGHTSIKKNDIVYDIGAGSGAISSVLANRAKKVVAIEVEPRMAEKLKENMQRYDNVTVIHGDFLTLPMPTVPYKIFANIPFHISSEIINKLTAADQPPKAAFMIVQKQFAKKLVIDSDSFTGQLGAKIAPWFTVRIRRPLRRTDYWPHPNVDTVLMELKPRLEPLLPKSDMAAYHNMIEQSFADPKKFAKTPRKAAGISEELKPSQLRLFQWVELYQKSRP